MIKESIQPLAAASVWLVKNFPVKISDLFKRRSVFSNHIDPGKAGIHIRMLLQIRHLFFQLVRRPDVITADNRSILCCHLPHSAVKVSKSCIFLHADGMNARITIRLNDFPAVIFRSIVHDFQLKILIRLFQNTFDRLPHILLMIV